MLVQITVSSNISTASSVSVRPVNKKVTSIYCKKVYFQDRETCVEQPLLNRLFVSY